MALATIFDHVVQEAADRLVLVAAMIEHEPADAEQMGEIGNRGALAHLAGVRGAPIVECIGVPGG